MVSTRNTSVDESLGLIWLRLTTLKASLSISSRTPPNRCGWRGTSISSKPGYFAIKVRCASSTCCSSPSWVLAAIQTRRVPNNALRKSFPFSVIAGSGLTSNLMLPVTVVLCGLAPSSMNRSASAWLCAAMMMPCDSVSLMSGINLR